MNDMLRYNFYLSKWFAGKKQDKIISGTAFLFLNQVSLLFLTTFLIIDKFIPLKLTPEMFTAIVMLATFIIMYCFQKPVQNYLRKRDYIMDLDRFSEKEIYFKRMLALLFFVSPFILCFLIAILVL